MRVFFSIRYDTIRYEGLKEDLLFEEFLANFLNFRRIFGEFSEFSANFWNFRRKKTKKSLVLRISRYSIWEVRYDILFDIRKSPIYRHSINSRYDKLPPGPDSRVLNQKVTSGLGLSPKFYQFFSLLPLSHLFAVASLVMSP